MAKRAAVLFLTLAAPAVLASFWLSPAAASTGFALLAPAFPIALIALGASRRGRVGPLALPLVALLVWVEGCIAGMLVLRGQVLDGPWLFGLPLAAAILVLGVLVAPLALVVLAYGLTFDRHTLRDEELRRLREEHG